MVEVATKGKSKRRQRMERWKCVLRRSPRGLGTGWLLARGDVTVKPADTREGKQAEAKHLELEKGEGGREGGRISEGVL